MQVGDFIHKFSQFYGKMTPGMTELLIQELSPFFPSQLKKGLRRICMEKNTRPSISYIVAEISKIKPSEISEKAKERVMSWDEVAEKVMQTKAGKIAIKEGWASSRVNECFYENKVTELDNVQIIKERSALTRAKEAYKWLEANKDKEPRGNLNCTNGLISLWKAMQDRELQMREKYDPIREG